jgi:energy-coupling factor transport system permease protein
MIRDITIGQFYPAKSRIHELDPRTKINGTFFFILSLFINQSLITYGLAFLALSAVIMATTIPVRFMLKPGTTVLLTLGRFTITSEGLQTAFYMGTRLIMLIIGSSVLTLTTSPITLTDGIEALLKPLERIKVPAHEIAMMMTIALRFIPILLEETDKIMKAQLARGADFESGGLIKKARSMVPLLVPLFISSFRRADDLALAMEARCYRGGEGRTRLKQLKYKKVDFWAYNILMLYLIIFVVLRFI